MAIVRKLFSWRIIKWLLMSGLFLSLCLAIFAIIYFIRVTKDLPSVKTLSEYQPPIMTRVHAGDGKLIAEYAEQHRVFVPIESIPKDIQMAFVAAEDQRFYQHNGFDEKGFVRAMVANIGHKLKGRRLEGGSTITQQVAKNFLVGTERTIARKIREILIATRIEKALDKDHVLELYLNEIYLGERSYGVAAAALNYFGKPLEKLTLSEMAYLAALPKAPNNYHFMEDKERAVSRRNYVLNRMVEDGYVEQDQADLAKQKDLVGVHRLTGEEYLAADYFVEEARRKIFSIYGEDELYKGGLSIRTTLDTDLQLAARRSLRKGLEAYDKRYGYRGPIHQFESLSDWKDKLDEFQPPRDIGTWRIALVLDSNAERANLGFALQDNDEMRPDNGYITLSGMKWARLINDKGQRGVLPKNVNDVLKAGDLILVSVLSKTGNEYALQQIPDVNGGLIAMDPHTGRILAMVGGYSFAQSQFNRTTQAKRQPGSSFKPFVYAAALHHEYTPASQVLDAPFVIKRRDTECEENENGFLELREVDEDGQMKSLQEKSENLDGRDETNKNEDECERFYKPGNYNENTFYGLSTLRLGLEKSRNLMTVRLANDIGMAPIMDYGRRFGIYDNPKPELAWVLGAGETTMMRLSSAYSALVNGGRKVHPYILDRVQNGQGQTVYVEGGEVCSVCKVDEWDRQQHPPELAELREQIIDPVAAYQVTYMLQGVVENGTGIIIKSLERPLGGKTGTTNDYLDAWFMGFSPDLVAGVYVGYDNPKTLNNEAGSKAAAPIFKDFMQYALKHEAKVPFRIPEGVSFAPINRKTGEPSYIGAEDYILEAFRPGTEPRIGETTTNIRVGSGHDTFFYGFEEDEEDIEVFDDHETKTSELIELQETQQELEAQDQDKGALNEGSQANDGNDLKENATGEENGEPEFSRAGQNDKTNSQMEITESPETPQDLSSSGESVEDSEPTQEAVEEEDLDDGIY